MILLGALGFANERGMIQANPGPQAKKPTEAPRASAGPTEEFHEVRAADLRHTILLNGELRAARSRDITAPRVQSHFGSAVTFLALQGAVVKQGERILEFDASALLSQRSEAQRKLDEAKLKIEKTRADLDATRSDLLNEVAQAEGTLKIAELYGKIGKEILAAKDYEKYQLDLEKAKLGIEKAKEKLANHERSVTAQLALVELDKAQAELELKKIEGDLSQLQVDAPQDGIIIYGDNWASNRKVQVGDTLFPGMPVLTLPDLGSMQVIGQVYDTELRFLTSGMACKISLDAIPGKSWEAKIQSLTSVGSRKGFASQHKVFSAVIQPSTIDLEVMKPGMTARIEVPITLASNILAIPRDYLGVDPLGRYFVRKKTSAETPLTQLVKIGTFNDRQVEIVEGLKAGDTLLRPR